MARRMSTTKPDNKFVRAIRSAAMIQPNELKAVALSFGFVFVMMAAWYMLRPVRDSLAANWSNTEISVLWNIQFFLSAAAVTLFGVAVAKVRFKYLVQMIYVLFAASFIALQLGSAWLSDPVLVDKIFYVWASLFSLFHLSVFWSFMADLYTKEQSGRLFAFIYVGSSAGALVGPIAATVVTILLGSQLVILIASLLLLVSIPAVYYLQYLKRAELGNEDVSVNLDEYRVGGNPLAGFKMFFTSPYLIGIAVFIALYTAIGSFAYFEQTNLLREYTEDQRTLILSLLSLTVNTLTFVLGFFVTNRLVTRFGMPTTLAIMPVVMCLALLALSFAPILVVLILMQIVRQAGNYGVTRPAREMLFTAVSRESRFKAKSVVDVVMYRGTDAVWAIAFAALTDGLGFSLGAMGAVGAGIAAVWIAAAIFLGRSFHRRGAESEPEAPDMPGRAHPAVSPTRG
jgi:AAA family ATP:ADP antiporter